VNREEGCLSFIHNETDLGVAYRDIDIINHPSLCFIVCAGYKNDRITILDE